MAIDERAVEAAWAWLALPRPVSDAYAIGRLVYDRSWTGLARRWAEEQPWTTIGETMMATALEHAWSERAQRRRSGRPW